MPREHFGAFDVALRIMAFRENARRPVAIWFTQIAEGGRVLRNLLCWLSWLSGLGANKAVILIFCRLSVLAVYEVRRQNGLAVFAGKLFITELGKGFYLRQPWGIVR